MVADTIPITSAMQGAIEQSLSVGKHKQTKSLRRKVFLQEKIAELIKSPSKSHFLIFPAYILCKHCARCSSKERHHPTKLCIYKSRGQEAFINFCNNGSSHIEELT